MTRTLIMIFMMSFLNSAMAFGIFQDPNRKILSQTKYLDKTVLKKALVAYYNAEAAGVTNSPIFTIIDYSMPSNKPRMWVIDLERNKVLFEELVSHGKNSGQVYAKQFSNRPESLQSSLGLFKTAESYYGQHGYALRLDGLEENVNHHARARGIVIHGGDYVTDQWLRREGRLGVSHGCPVVDPSINKSLINTIKGGTLVFAYYPERTWLAGSAFLQEG
jgi:hypothetical protein